MLDILKAVENLMKDNKLMFNVSKPKCMVIQVSTKNITNT